MMSDAQFEALMTTFAEFRSEVRGKLSTMHQDILGIKGDIAGLKGDVIVLHADLEVVKEDVQTTNQVISELNRITVGVRVLGEDCYNMLQSHLGQTEGRSKSLHDEAADDVEPARSAAR